MRSEVSPEQRSKLAPLTRVRMAFWEGLRPDRRQSLSDWAAEHRRLPKEAASEPGRWRNERTPYLVEIMDCLSPESPVERVVFMKGAQVGGTEAGNNFVGYVIDRGMGPTLVVVKTDSLARAYSKQRLAPLIRDTPSLRFKVKDSKKRDSGNTLLQKDFPGGVLMLRNAEAAAGLRSMPIRNLFMDEIDSYPQDAEGEGDPCELAVKRTATFHRRKILEVSTPTVEGSSRIASRFDETDQRYFMVPCPECDHLQRLVWSQVKFEVDDNGRLDRDSVGYACAGCGALLREHQKTTMLAGGRWEATNPHANPDVRGYHLSALYSPVGWFSWQDAVEQFLEAKNDPLKLKVFVNTVLGETWKEKSDAPDWKRIYRNREQYRTGVVPEGAVFLTAGVDVQRDRLELEVTGWGRGRESWSVDYLVLEGDPAEQAVWEGLEAVLSRSWKHARGGELTIRMLAIDSGDQTSTVYSWARKFPGQVMAVKGSDSIPQVVGSPRMTDINLRGKRIRRGVQLWPVGSSATKRELYALLRLDPPTEKGEPYPQGYCHFPEESQYDKEYFKQLTAERLVFRKDPRGYTKHVWEKMRERNEAIDCRVYSRAAAEVVGLSRWTEERWAKEEAALVGGPPKSTKRKRRTNPYTK